MPMTTAAAAKPPKEHASLTRLRTACRTLFARQGFHHTRPQDIAAEAGVANGTFYLHFKDKQEAFLDFSQQAQIEVRELYAERLDGIVGERARWEVILNAMLDFSEQHPGVLLVAFMDPLFVAPEHEEAWELYERMGHFIEMAVGDATAY
ncbi:MAG: TetR family transcriptional regulator [Gammaproteobacteria bacterium]|nr:TetR family transcriptional regulator [Gammaproteobacteria bacterium]